jgi:hypothetical protein
VELNIAAFIAGFTAAFAAAIVVVRRRARRGKQA